MGREEIALRRQAFGSEDPSVAVAEGELAEIVEVAHPQEALQLSLHALGVFAHSVAASDQRVLEMKIQILPRLGWFGRYDEAERMANDVSTALRASTKPNQLQLQTLLNMWSQLEFLREDYAKAEQRNSELIDLLQSLQGKSTPAADSQLFFRAFLRGLQGHLDDSARDLDQITARRTAKGKALPSNWLLMHAIIDIRRDEFAAAEKMLREGLARDEAMFHGGSLWSAQTKSVLALALMGEGRDADAERMLRDSLRMEDELFGAPIPEHGRTLLNLARLLSRNPDRREEAHGVALEASLILGRFLGEQNARAREAAALAQNTATY